MAFLDFLTFLPHGQGSFRPARSSSSEKSSFSWAMISMTSEAGRPLFMRSRIIRSGRSTWWKNCLNPAHR